MFYFKHILIKAGSFNHRLISIREGERRGTKLERGERREQPEAPERITLGFNFLVLSPPNFS